MLPGSSISRLIVRSVAFIACIVSCAASPERLSQLDRQFYYNLETLRDRRAFLVLEPAYRQSFLHDHGLWEKWLALSAEEQRSVREKNVKSGMNVFVAHMVWGAPADIRYREFYQRMLRLETFIRCTSGWKVGRFVRQNVDCNGTSAEQQISVTNERIIEIRYMD